MGDKRQINRKTRAKVQVGGDRHLHTAPVFSLVESLSLAWAARAASLAYRLVIIPTHVVISKQLQFRCNHYMCRN